jgi:hypothetical protein
VLLAGDRDFTFVLASLVTREGVWCLTPYGFIVVLEMERAEFLENAYRIGGGVGPDSYIASYSTFLYPVLRSRFSVSSYPSSYFLVSLIGEKYDGY